MEHLVLFKTVHGSRLYGLSHEDSDWDYYTVVDRVKKNKAKYATHKIIDDVDSVVVDFGTWMGLCQKGVPQALEAMFSQQPIVDNLSEFRANFVAGTNYDAYLRTIKALAFEDDFKHKRHAIRLAIEMREMREKGRFNPTLSPVDIDLANSLANLRPEHVYNDALAIAWA